MQATVVVDVASQDHETLATLISHATPQRS
jgi:hypothetical protein